MDDVEIIKSYYAAFNAKDWDKMASLVDDNVLHFTNQGDFREGRATFLTFLREMAISYNEWVTNLVVFTGDVEGRCAAEYLVNGIYAATYGGLPPASGQKYVVPGGAFLDIYEGRIRRITTYYNAADWLEQVSTERATEL